MTATGSAHKPGVFDSMSGRSALTTSGARPALQQAPGGMFETIPGRPSTAPTAVMPAYRAGSSAPPVLNPSPTGSQHGARTAAFPALPPREEEPIAPAENAAELQREIRARALSGLSSSVPPSRSQPARLPPSATDTFVKQKMKEAETNLPDFDFDFDVDE